MVNQKKIRKELMDKLINVKNEWSYGTDAGKVESAMRRIEVQEVQCAIE